MIPIFCPVQDGQTVFVPGPDNFCSDTDRVEFSRTRPNLAREKRDRPRVFESPGEFDFERVNLEAAREFCATGRDQSLAGVRFPHDGPEPPGDRRLPRCLLRESEQFRSCDQRYEFMLFHSCVT